MVKKERYHINLVGGVGPARGRGRDVGKRGRAPKNVQVGGGRPKPGGGRP